MKKAKIMAGILAFATVASSLAGCGSKSNTTSTTVGTGPKKYDQQVEIKIPVYDRGVQGQAPVDNNYWTQWIQKNFGDKYNIKVTFVPIPRTTEVDKFNLLLASNTAPDIIFNYDYPTAMSFYSRGAYQEISQSMLKSYAPDFLKYAGDTMKYGQVNGKQIFMTATRPNAYNWVGLIRQDWLDKAGLTMPKSQEDMEKALLKFKEMKLGGAKTIPSTQSLMSPYIGAYDYRDYPLSEKDNALYSDITVAALTWEPVHKELQRLNKWYNEGLLSPEWALDKDGKTAQADFMNGTAGTYAFYLSQTPPVLQTLVKNAPTAKVSFVPSEAGFPQGTKVTGREAWSFGMLSGINKSCKHPEAVLMYLNWMCNKDNLFTLQNGIEGKTYTLDNGLPKLVTGYTGTEALNYNSNKDIWCLVTEGKDYGSEDKNVAVQKTTYAPAGFENLITDSYNNYKKYEKTNYTDFLFDRALDSSTKYNNVLKSKWEQIQVKLVMAKPADFENLYKEACKDYLASGYQTILDEKTKVYNEMKSSKK